LEKNAKAYILNADDLGGFKQRPGGTDNVLQKILASAPVWGGSGSYPLEGGYIYFTPLGNPTVCYKFGFDGNGSPFFTLAGQTPASAANRVGIGPPTITTYNDQPGTGILWICDLSAGIQAFSAVPNSDGVLTPIPLPLTGGCNKFQRPAFGDGRLYFSDIDGNVYCLGSSGPGPALSSTSAASAVAESASSVSSSLAIEVPESTSSLSNSSPVSSSPSTSSLLASSSLSGTSTPIETATPTPTPTVSAGVAVVNNYSIAGALLVMIAFLL